MICSVLLENRIDDYLAIWKIQWQGLKKDNANKYTLWLTYELKF